MPKRKRPNSTKPLTTETRSITLTPLSRTLTIRRKCIDPTTSTTKTHGHTFTITNKHPPQISTFKIHHSKFID